MKKNNLKRVGSYLRKKRLAAGKTQAQVAGFLKYTSKQIVSNWERCKCTSPIGHMRHLIDYLDLDQHEVPELLVEIKRSELVSLFNRT